MLKNFYQDISNDINTAEEQETCYCSTEASGHDTLRKTADRKYSEEK